MVSWWALAASAPLVIVGILFTPLAYTVIKFVVTIPRYRHIPRRHKSPWFILLKMFDGNGGLEECLQELFDPQANHYSHVTYEGFFFGGAHQVALTNPEDFRTVLGDPNSFKKDGTYVIIEDFLGKGLVSARGDTWKLHRRVLTPAFHFQFLKGLTSLMARSAGVLVDSLAGTQAQPTDPYHHFSQAAMEVIIESSVGSGLLDVAQLSASYKELAGYFLNYFVGVMAFGPFLKYLPFDFATRMPRKKREVLSMIASAVAKRRATLELAAKQPGEQQPQCNDFVTLMLASGELTEEEILDEGLTFFFAAHDTISSMLAWAFFFLCKHPEYQAKIQRELDEGGFDLENTSAEDLARFPLLKMFVNETLRLRPPVIALTRELTKDHVLSGHRLPAGTVVNMIFQATHLDPAYWDDPERFYPERFASDSEEATARHPFAFLPFSAGPRSCIGKRFAIQEAQIFLAAVIQRFNVEGKTQGILIDTMSISRPKGFTVAFIPRTR